METTKMVTLLLMLALGSSVAVQAARDLARGEVHHPENIYGGVGGVGGVVPGEGGGGQPVVVSGGTTFNCPFPGIAACTITVHNPTLPGGGGDGGGGGVGGVTNP